MLSREGKEGERRRKGEGREKEVGTSLSLSGPDPVSSAVVQLYPQ
jgi:hypothetical protein